MKEAANPIVVRLHRGHLGGAIPAEGIPLQEIKDRLRRKVLDAEVEVRDRTRFHGGRRRGHTLRVRLVGVRDTERGVYHWHLANLAPEVVPAEQIGKIDGAGWSIELLFRALTSCYQLGAIPGGKREVMEMFLYAAVLVVLLSRALLRAVCRWGQPKIERAPAERRARLLVSAAPTLLTIVLDPLTMARYREPPSFVFSPRKPSTRTSIVDSCYSERAFEASEPITDGRRCHVQPSREADGNATAKVKVGVSAIGIIAAERAPRPGRCPSRATAVSPHSAHRSGRRSVTGCAADQEGTVTSIVVD